MFVYWDIYRLLLPPHAHRATGPNCRLAWVGGVRPSPTRQRQNGWKFSLFGATWRSFILKKESWIQSISASCPGLSLALRPRPSRMRPQALLRMPA